MAGFTGPSDRRDSRHTRYTPQIFIEKGHRSFADRRRGGSRARSQETEVQNSGGLRDFGKDYAIKEAALFKAAGAELPITPTEPIAPPTEQPQESLNGRDSAAPSDPNNTGAKGTQMGLSGGSISPEFTTNDFLNLLGRQGITMTNPFGNQPLPATPAGNEQHRLNPGKIVGSSVGATTKPGDSVEVDSVGAHLGDIAGRMETNRTLSPDDSTVDGEKATDWSVDQRSDEMMARRAAFLDPNNKGYSAIRAADAAMGLGRQAVPGGGERLMAMNPEGELVSVTQEGYDLRKRGEISAQDLLSQHLAEAPAKAVEKAIESGDADTVTEPSLAIGGTIADTDGSVGEAAGQYAGAFDNLDEDKGFFSNTRKNIKSE